MEPGEEPDAAARIAALPIWKGRIEVAPLAGGLTNRNYRVRDGGGDYVVRLGDDIPHHSVMRFNEAAAAVAAFRAGVSPEIVHLAPGIMVSRFVAGRTLTPADIRQPAQVERIVELLRRCHRDMDRHHTGPVLAFWVFKVIRSYLALLEAEGSRVADRLDLFARACGKLEAAVGRVDIAFCHNDLLAANFIDDGDRLWLLDWDYAGMNTPLFDLANLSSNNGFDAGRDEALLECYFGARPDARLVRTLDALKCASLLRETLWSAVSETRSSIDFDFQAYTEDNFGSFERAMREFGG